MQERPSSSPRSLGESDLSRALARRALMPVEGVWILQKMLFGGSGGIAALEFGNVNFNLSRRLSNSEYLEEVSLLKLCLGMNFIITFS